MSPPGVDFFQQQQKMPAKQKSCMYDYEAFAPQLKWHKCIRDVNNDNYCLGDYRAVAFDRIERNMGIKREFSFSRSQCLHIHSRSNCGTLYLVMMNRQINISHVSHCTPVIGNHLYLVYWE